MQVEKGAAEQCLAIINQRAQTILKQVHIDAQTIVTCRIDLHHGKQPVDVGVFSPELVEGDAGLECFRAAQKVSRQLLGMTPREICGSTAAGVPVTGCQLPG